MSKLIFGHTWQEIQDMQQGKYQPKTIDMGPGDYGADPLPQKDGTVLYKMIPSGDVVNFEERQKRLSRRK